MRQAVISHQSSVIGHQSSVISHQGTPYPGIRLLYPAVVSY
jgi:hypothetical protein